MDASTLAVESLRLASALASLAPEVVAVWRSALDSGKTDKEAIAEALLSAQRADHGPMRDAFDAALTAHRERVSQRTAVARASVADVAVLRRLVKARSYTAEEASALLHAADHVESDVT
jgi:hypothetical protein